MKIYKFKGLTNKDERSHFLQIVLQNSIWCARPGPNSLNDEDEFKFKLDYEPSPNTFRLLSDLVAKYRTTNVSPQLAASQAINKLEDFAAPSIEKIIRDCRNTIGIASFSITTNGHLWEEYGGKGNGVFVEINIPDHLVGDLYHRVHYVPDKIFHVDSFLESDLFPDRAFESYRNILLTKTKEKWSKEEEIRFIGKRQDVKFIFDGYISEVTFGPHVPTDIFEQLVEQITKHCSANNIKITKL